MDETKNSGLYFVKYDLTDKTRDAARNYTLAFVTCADPASLDQKIIPMLAADNVKVVSTGRESISSERYAALKQDSFNYFNELQGSPGVIVYNFKPTYSGILPKEDITLN